MKKILIFILTISMVMGFSANTFAASKTTQNGVIQMDSGDAQIKIVGNEGQSLVGKEFTLYKLFDAENSVGMESIRYTYNSAFKEVLQHIVGKELGKESAAVTEYEVIDYIQSLNQYETKDAKASQTNESSYSEFRSFVDRLRGMIVEEGILGQRLEITSTDAYNGVLIDGLEYGYYILDEVTNVSGTHQASSLCMVNTANPTANVAIKSDYPTATLKIQEDDNRETIGNDGWNDIGDYEIGQDVPFKVTSSIPNLNGYDNYYWAWHDVMDKALTLQEDTIQIVLSGTNEGISKQYTFPETEYALTTDSVNNTFKIEIKDIKAIIDREFDNLDANGENLYGQDIKVVFNATLNDKAFADLGRPGFENDVRLEFSNNPNAGKEDQTGYTPWDTVVCYSYQLNGIKINNYGTTLAGAEFRLYLDEECGQEVLVKEVKNGYQIVNPDSMEVLESDKTKAMVSDSDGEFRIFGLDAGTYYLKETSAPTGYRPILEPIQLQVTPKFTEKRNDYVKGDGAGDEIVELAANAKIKTFVLGSYTDKNSSLEVNQEQGSINLAVVNQVGLKLPVTGSQLMVFLVGVGILLMSMSVWSGKKRHE